MRQIFELYLEHQAMLPVVSELNRRGWLTKHWVTRKGVNRGARPFTKNALHKILTNIVYIGKNPSLIAEVTNKVRQHASKETQRLQKERQTLVTQIQTDHQKFESLAATTDHTQRIAGFAELHERQDKAKRCLDEIEKELAALQSNEIDDAEITAALSNFNEVWDKLSPREQSRLVALLIERVEYDGREGNVSITFQPAGIRALRDEMATPEQVARPAS